MGGELKRLEQIQKEISLAQNSKHAATDVTILAAVKRQPVAKLQEIISAGITDFGENYLQEALDKMKVLNQPSVNWHFIGHLQSKKCKSVVGVFSLIHSVDRQSLIEAIAKAAAQKNLVQDILLQVNLSGEETKSGCSLQELPTLIELCEKTPGIKCIGLMTMPPLMADPEQVRPYFSQLRELGQQFGLRHLSMGTSSDFTVAVEEGATIIRLGRALLGERQT